jgi:hypothetical protein
MKQFTGQRRRWIEFDLLPASHAARAGEARGPHHLQLRADHLKLISKG